MAPGHILIGEAGGSNTQWRLSSGGDSVEQFATAGFNPQTNRIEDLLEDLQQRGIDREAIGGLYFYAAGLITEAHFVDTASAFQRLFPKAQVEVQNDALAAARGLCGHAPGWVGFLGTGAGMVHYDGIAISKQVDSLGFILGDEGSGAYLGKQLTRDFFRGRMPAELSQDLSEHFGELGSELQQIYRNKGGNAHLGRLAKVIFPFRDTPYVNELIRQAFHAYFEAFGSAALTGPIHFTGSIAFHYQAILREVAQERDFAIGRIVQSPIAGLLLYHEVL